MTQDQTEVPLAGLAVIPGTAPASSDEEGDARWS